MFEGLRKFIERGKKGYCYEDLWSFYYFFSEFLVRALKEFKQTCHTYPSTGITWEEWMASLDEMIECFEEQCRDLGNVELDTVKWNEKREYQKQKLHRGLELLEKYYYDLWD